MSDKDTKNIIEALRASGYIEYGKEIPMETFREAIGIYIPESGTFEDFKHLTTTETFSYLNVKGILLSEGKCFVKTGSNYRILALSEHEDKAQGYMDEARSKMDKSQKLMQLVQPTDQAGEIRKGKMLTLIEFRKNSFEARRNASR